MGCVARDGRVARNVGRGSWCLTAPHCTFVIPLSHNPNPTPSSFQSESLRDLASPAAPHSQVGPDTTTSIKLSRSGPSLVDHYKRPLPFSFALCSLLFLLFA